MALLYESVMHVRTKKLRPKSVSRQLQAVADHYHVIEEYAVDSIYMTPDQLRDHIRDALRQACEQKGEKLEYFAALEEWAIWKVFYSEYHIKYEAYIGGGSSLHPISQLVALAIIALCLAIVIVFAIWLVITYVVEPIWGVIPEEAKPYVGTLLVVGLGLLIAGGGVYLLKSVLPKIKRKKE